MRKNKAASRKFIVRHKILCFDGTKKKYFWKTKINAASNVFFIMFHVPNEKENPVLTRLETLL